MSDYVSKNTPISHWQFDKDCSEHTTAGGADIFTKELQKKLFAAFELISQYKSSNYGGRWKQKHLRAQTHVFQLKIE